MRLARTRSQVEQSQTPVDDGWHVISVALEKGPDIPTSLLMSVQQYRTSITMRLTEADRDALVEALRTVDFSR